MMVVPIDNSCRGLDTPLPGHGSPLHYCRGLDTPLPGEGVSSTLDSRQEQELRAIHQDRPVAAWKPLSNLTAHITYGNRGQAGKGMKLAAWNAGNAYLENKLNEIEKVIESVKPHVLIISEGNLRQCVDKSTVKISGYELFTAETITNSDIKNIS